MHTNNGDPRIADLPPNPAINGKVGRSARLRRVASDLRRWVLGRPQLSPALPLLAADAYVLAMIDAARTERGMQRIARRAPRLKRVMHWNLRKQSKVAVGR